MTIWERLAERGITPNTIRGPVKGGIDEILTEGVMPVKPHHATNHYAFLEQGKSYSEELVQKTTFAVSSPLSRRKDIIGLTHKDRELYKNGLRAALKVHIFLPKDFSVLLTPYNLDLMCLNCTIGAHCRQFNSDTRRGELEAITQFANTANDLGIAINCPSRDTLKIRAKDYKTVLQNLPINK